MIVIIYIMCVGFINIYIDFVCDYDPVLKDKWIDDSVSISLA